MTLAKPDTNERRMVIFLSPADNVAGVPPELIGTEGETPLDLALRRARASGEASDVLHVVQFEEDRTAAWRPRRTRLRLKACRAYWHRHGIGMIVEEFPSFENWLESFLDGSDWLTLRPYDLRSSATPETSLPHFRSVQIKQRRPLLLTENMRCN